MEITKYDKKDVKILTKRSQSDVNQVLKTVTDIINNVKINKDKSVKEYTEKFDGVFVEDLKVTENEIKQAYENLDENLINSLKSATENIKKFHTAQIPKEYSMEVKPGINAGQIIRPINSVGCYIPGGRAAYPSSILMTVIPAKIAGVKRIICCTPPNKEGKILDAILVAADIAGADEIYKVGGAQAIAAMAYGTESIKPVEKIVGPGNVFVTAAKKLVYGEVDIEFPAGPSELLVLADETAIPEYIAYDILSQAEHDPNASCFFVTPSKELAEKTKPLIEKYAEEAVRSEIIKESLNKYGKILLTENLEDAIDFTNEYAPEHLIITTKNDTQTLSKINNAGSIFIGKYSPVAAGDYGSGTNHVLPTGQGARMYSGLSTEAFLKKPTIQTLTLEGLKELSKTILPIADYEGFAAHGDSVKVRINKK
ncbi:histidinol dehydrogenase [Methanobrevibacter acididurans]|uniref:histidinol dehydrogenase n=1 Tax=Methanobrevibacter acididurans TaxID=120963 RepID=UPI0038FC01B7